MTKSRLITERPKPSLQGSYRPPNILNVRNKEPGYRYRWVKLNDQQPFFGGVDHRNWEVVRAGAGGQECQDTEFTGTFNQWSPKAMGSIVRAGDLILARMPEEQAQERNDNVSARVRQNYDRTRNPMRDVAQKDQRFFTGSVEGLARPLHGQVDLGGVSNG